MIFNEIWGLSTYFHERPEYKAGRESVLGIAIATGWTVRVSNPSWGEMVHICPDGPMDPPSMLYSGYQDSSPEVRRPGRGVNHPPLI